MANSEKKPATSNGLVYINGQWLMQCGSTAYPVKLQDASGKPVPPPEETAVLKVSTS